jgi:hypothetical protein
MHGGAQPFHLLTRRAGAHIQVAQEVGAGPRSAEKTFLTTSTMMVSLKGPQCLHGAVNRHNMVRWKVNELGLWNSVYTQIQICFYHACRDRIQYAPLCIHNIDRPTTTNNTRYAITRSQAHSSISQSCSYVPVVEATTKVFRVSFTPPLLSLATTKIKPGNITRTKRVIQTSRSTSQARDECFNGQHLAG